MASNARPKLPLVFPGKSLFNLFTDVSSHSVEAAIDKMFYSNIVSTKWNIIYVLLSLYLD